MKTVIKATAVVLGVTIVLGAAYLAVELLWLGNIEPKLGGRWDNFVLGMQLLLIIGFAESVGFFLLATLFRGVVQLAGLSIFTSAVVMAVTTIFLWPPKASQPFLVAGGISAIAFAAGLVVSRIAKPWRDRATT